jgi:hypothetical protein
MKKNSLILLAAVILLFVNCGSVDTHENRRDKAKEILRKDCTGLCNMMVEYLKNKASIETDTWYEKAGEGAVRFAVGMECGCMSDKLAEVMADKFTLAEINAMEGKDIKDIDGLPGVLLTALPDLKDCIPFL